MLYGLVSETCHLRTECLSQLIFYRLLKEVLPNPLMAKNVSPEIVLKERFYGFEMPSRSDGLESASNLSIVCQSPRVYWKNSLIFSSNQYKFKRGFKAGQKNDLVAYLQRVSRCSGLANWCIQCVSTKNRTLSGYSRAFRLTGPFKNESILQVVKKTIEQVGVQKHIPTSASET